MTSPTAHDVANVVVVTGASSGIGEETALGYAGRRARLVLAARDEAKLRRVADKCLRAGAADVLIHTADITDADEVQTLFETAVARFGQIDVAIQSAGVTSFGRFEDVPVEVFDKVVRTNLLGAANVARSALIYFHERGEGQLVLIGSLLGVTAVPYESAYVASKFALHGLVRALRQENRHLPDVRIHGIYPGAVDTSVYGSASVRPPTVDTPVSDRWVG
jgi:short-subunit dehydrogenase